MDYFDVAGLKYLVIRDRFTGWPEVFRQNGKAMTLVRTYRNLFSQFGNTSRSMGDRHSTVMNGSALSFNGVLIPDSPLRNIRSQTAEQNSL